MKTFLCIILTIFFSGLIGAFTLPKTSYALCNSITANPSFLNPTQQTTINFSVPVPSGEKNYLLDVLDPKNKQIVTRTGTTSSGSGQETIGPFSDTGSYTVNLSTKIPSAPASAYQTECFTSFTVVNPGNMRCPPFQTTNPSPPTSGTSITLVFATSADITHLIVVDNDPNKFYKLSAGQNQTNIGSYNSGTHKFSLSPDTVPPSTCYSISFTVKTSSTSSTTGTNPCLQPDGTISCPTAIGNIPGDAAAFAQTILRLATGIAGGLALILMVVGAVRVLTSSGDQQKLAGGRDMIVAAIAGLLFLIFSVLILSFIGINILQIPNFGASTGPH